MWPKRGAVRRDSKRLCCSLSQPEADCHSNLGLLQSRMLALCRGERVRLHAAGVGDLGLAAIAHLATLEELYIDSRLFTDQGLKAISTLTALRCLDVFGARISDAGCVHFRHGPQAATVFMSDKWLAPSRSYNMFLYGCLESRALLSRTSTSIGNLYPAGTCISLWPVLDMTNLPNQHRLGSAVLSSAE